MSNLRERARKVREAGAAERGNFAPSGTPLRMYRFWATHSNNVPPRENFCHYWRVVAFWAPLMFLRVKGVRALDSTVVQVGLGVFAVVALVLAAIFTPAAPFLLGVLIAFLLVAGIFTGMVEGLDDTTDTVRVVFWLSCPVSVPVYGICKLVKWIGGWSHDAKEVGKSVLIGLGVFVIVGLLLTLVISVIVVEGWLFLLMAIGVLAAGAAAFLGLIVGVSALADWIVGMRMTARKRSLEKTEALPAVQKVDKPVVSKGPGPFRRAMRSLGDFIIFAAQVVRVKKWKICPIVQVDNEESA